MQRKLNGGKCKEVSKIFMSFTSFLRPFYVFFTSFLRKFVIYFPQICTD